MKTTKGGKVMNPTDAYRKEIRKKELKRNKKERKKVREVGILKKDPDSLKDQIEKLEFMKADGALDKARKHKKRQLEDTLNLVLKKRKEHESKLKEKGETPVMFSHLGLPTRRHSSAEEEERNKNPQPEDSVYYHPTLNPTGAPPPGKPPMFKSSIEPRLSAASSSGTASTSVTEPDDVSLSLPPPPPPPPLPTVGEFDSGDGSVVPASLPLPPPPPMQPKTVVSDLVKPLPPPPFPVAPPPAREQLPMRPPLPPPPIIQQHQSTQPRPPGIGGSERESQSSMSDNQASQDLAQVHARLPPPPPPPGMPVKSTNNQPEGVLTESSSNDSSIGHDLSKMIPPPPPPRQQPPPIPRPPLMPTFQHPDLLPPGISHYLPPPPPTDMRQHVSVPGVPIQSAPPGMMVSLMARPPFGLPPGPPPPPMMKPPLPPGPPPSFEEDDYVATRPQAHQKPSYIKSAASTVVKRPLAQHTPELTSMVPASVRVRRESAISKPKAKPPPQSTTTTRPVMHKAAPILVKSQPGNSQAEANMKPKSIDDSYMAFLEDMKELGALDG